jgi:two-component system response regulator ArlR
MSKEATMRLLLAEDEEQLSSALCAILRHNGYEVDAALNGLDALSMLQDGCYDAAILDIMMPGLDGIMVLKKAREDGLRLPIIMLTAKGEIEDKVLGLDSGANDYLTKPFSSRELLARLRAMTRRSGDSSGSAVLKAGNLTLDMQTCCLSSPKGSFKLANKEFRLMELLMARPSQVISTQVFRDKVWGWDAETDISVVWVYLSCLRKKLTELSSTVQIKASRNLGYSLEAIE